MADSETAVLLEAADDYFAGHWGPKVARRLADMPVAELRAKWAELHQLGLHELLVAEHAGGFGIGAAEMAKVFASAGRYLLPALSLDTILSVPYLAASATVEAQDLIRRTVADDLVIVVAAGWTDADGQLADDPWTGVQLRNGRLTGRRTLVGYGAAAQMFLVTAREGRVPVIAACRAPGSTQVRALRGIDACDAPADVRLDEAPAETALARGDDAVTLWDSYAAWARLAGAAEMLGVVDRLTEMSVQYATERIAFGRAISTFQAVRHMLAQMTVDVHSLRALTDYAAAALNDGAAEGSALAISASVRAATVGKRIAETALQVHAGIGFTSEHDLHLYFKRAMTLQGRFGEPRQLYRERAKIALASQIG